MTLVANAINTLLVYLVHDHDKHDAHVSSLLSCHLGGTQAQGRAEL